MKKNSEQIDIKFSDLLKEKFIALNLKAKEKNKLIFELVDNLSSSARLKNKKAIFKAILEREKLGSTAIGNGVAIPHVKLKGIKKILLFLGRSQEGVDFEALDGEKTYLFFLLISPQEKMGLHLKILAKISRLIKDKFIVEQLKKASTKQQIIQLIVNAEQELLK